MTGTSSDADLTSQSSGVLILPPSVPTISLLINSATIATAITCKPTSTNFLLWKAQVVPILRGVQLFGYLDGTTPMPAAMVIEGTGTAVRQVINPARNTWIIQDQAILGGLLSSMTEDLLPQLTHQIDTSGQLWTSLHTMFSAQHRGNLIQIRTQLSTTRKGDMGAAEYYQKMTGFADTMSNIGHPMSDEEVIGYILAGLGPGHDDLFTAITVLRNQRTVTLPEFYSYLLAHETQATLMSGTAEFTSSANNACVRIPILLAVTTTTMATPTPTTTIRTTTVMAVVVADAAVVVARTMAALAADRLFS